MPGLIAIPPANPRMSNLAAGMVPQELSFIDRLVPVTQTTERVGTYVQYTVNDRPRNDRIGAFTKPWPSSSALGTQGSYLCDPHGHEMPAARLQSAAAYQSDMRNAMFLASRVVQFNKVFYWLEILSDAANYGTNTSSPTVKWSDKSADIRADIRAKARIAGQGIRRDTLALGEDVFECAVRNAGFIESFKGIRTLPNNEDELTQALADYLGVKTIERIGLSYNSAAEGQTPDYVDVWAAETVSFYHRGQPVTNAGVPQTDEAGRPLIEEMQPAFARQMVYTGVPGASQGIGVWTREDGEAGFGVTYVRAAQIYADPEITQPELGWLFTNTL